MFATEVIKTESLKVEVRLIYASAVQVASVRHNCRKYKL